MIRTSRDASRALAAHKDQEEHWVSVSDMMAGLMMVFLLIAIIFMLDVQASLIDEREEKSRIEQLNRQIERAVAVYDRYKIALYEALWEEFKEDLDRWGATIDREELSIRFHAPEVLFDRNQSTLKDEYKRILDEFFPRYMDILLRPEFQDGIEEVRIEGHTSSAWEGAANEIDAFLMNMRLSQDRTRSTLEYVLAIDGVDQDFGWLNQHVTANGLSSSKLKYKDGHEDPIASRRVEFRIRTNAETRIEDVLGIYESAK